MFGLVSGNQLERIPYLASPIATTSVTPETAILDADTATAKKSIERKKHPRIVNALKESIGATTIKKRILYLAVNFTIGKLLASTPVVEKQVTKAISKNEAVQFFLNVLS